VSRRRRIGLARRGPNRRGRVLRREGSEGTDGRGGSEESFVMSSKTSYIYIYIYLRRADENWTRSHPYSRFGPSYHTSLPSHWAQQLLGLNLTITLHNHFRKRIRAIQSRHSRTQPPSSRTQYTPRGRPFYTTPYTSRLRTMRTHEDL
jgi:hypothetical protein